MLQWKEIQGFNYYVSNEGHVKNSQGKMLKPYNNGNGYLKVSLYKNGKRYRFFIHRLVGLAFVNGYENGLTIDHIDMDKTNNCSDNLEWVTLEENVKRMHSHKS